MFVIHAYQVLDHLYIRATWIPKSGPLGDLGDETWHASSTLPVGQRATVGDILGLVAEELANQAEAAHQQAI